MTDTKEFEAELARMNRRNGRLQWLTIIPIGVFAAVLRAGIWFIVVGLLAAGIAWLTGSNNPRGVAIFWGCVSVPFAVLWTVVLIAGALRK